MTSNLASRPAWQTEELAEAWIDEEEYQESVDGSKNSIRRCSHGSTSDGSLGRHLPTSTSIEISGTLPTGHHHTTLLTNETSCGQGNSDTQQIGTFVVREDQPAVQMLPATPGRQKKGAVKTMFSRSALEMMFDPPSPPDTLTSAPECLPNSTQPGPVHSAPPPTATRIPPLPQRNDFVFAKATMNRPMRPSKLSQVIGTGSTIEEEEEEGGGENGGEKHEAGVAQEEDSPREQPNTSRSPPPRLEYATGTCQFTFEVPQTSHPPDIGTEYQNPTPPQAQSTPINPRIDGFKQFQGTNAPLTDPRLRLFHFNYDTYTREHLSALVDSFGVNSPSGSSSSPSSGATAHSHILATPESHDSSSPMEKPYTDEGEGRDADDHSFMHLRSTKRIKLEQPLELKAGLSPGKPRIGKLRPRRESSEARTPLSARFKTSTPSTGALEGAVRDRDETVTGSEQTRKPTLQRGSINSRSKGNYSSLGYRQQGADLMAKIRGDMKSTKRLFSEKTDASMLSQVEEESSVEERSVGPSPEVPPVLLPAVPTPRKVSGGNQAQQTPLSPQGRPMVSPRRLSLHVKEPCDIFCNEASTHPGIQVFTNIPMPLQRPMIQQIRTADRIRSPNPTFLAPPFNGGSRSQPVPTQNAEGNTNGVVSASTNEDLNRFVSSSTTATTVTMTTLTSGSGGSFVKHPGPPVLPSPNTHTHIVRIGPNDVPELPERVGPMIYDRQLMRWVKERSGSRRVQSGQLTGNSTPTDRRTPGAGDTEGESEDPFRDIESLREENSSRRQSLPATSVVQAPVPELSERDSPPTEERAGDVDGHIVEESLIGGTSHSDMEVIDDEEHQLTFSFDDPAIGVVQVMKGYAETDETTDSEDEQSVRVNTTRHDIASWDGEDHDTDSEVEFVSDALASMSFQAHSHSEVHAASTESSVRVDFHAEARTYANTPMPKRRVQHPVRSALKSASVTPSGQSSQTPHPRSVSFSDGRQDGKIIGLNDNTNDLNGLTTATVTHVMNGTSFIPSLRTQRIAEMLANLENPSFGTPYLHDITQRPQPLTDTREVAILPGRDLPRTNPSKRYDASSPQFMFDVPDPRTPAGVTFLTECSFRVAQERLVHVITDIHPFEPHWESLASIDLSRKRLESIAHLKEFLPKLDSLYLNNNFLSWLTGVPTSVRTLAVSSNILTSLTSFLYLTNLENLDISYNKIESLEQLSHLHHLRELRADGNQIKCLDGLANLDGLIKLSAQGNELRNIDFSGYNWARLEALNLGGNRLETVSGLGSLASLVILNLDDNSLVFVDTLSSTSLAQIHQAPGEEAIRIVPVLQKLRVLRLSGNRLTHLDVLPYPNLRTLYVDSNCLVGDRNEDDETLTDQNYPRLANLQSLAKLENLSARHQRGERAQGSSLHLSIEQIRDVKRLYLSGNPSPFPVGSSVHACYNLVYLELAACRLTELPRNFSMLVPNLRVLNLNYNFLETDAVVRALTGLKRLRKVTVVGSRMAGTKALIRTLGAMGEHIEMLDFRMNPCTLVWYLPLLVQDSTVHTCEPQNGHQEQRPHHNQLHAFAAFSPPTPAPGAVTTTGGSTFDSESGTGTVHTEAIGSVRVVPREVYNHPTRGYDGGGWREPDEVREERAVERGGNGNRQIQQESAHGFSTKKGKTAQKQAEIDDAYSTAYGDHKATRDGQRTRVDGDDVTVTAGVGSGKHPITTHAIETPQPGVTDATATDSRAKATAAPSQLASASAHGPSSSTQHQHPAGTSQKTSYELLDTEFRHSLPERTYAARLAYRGLVMRACPKLQVLDGVRITDREKAKAEAYLKGVLEGVKDNMKTAAKAAEDVGEKTEIVVKGRVQEWVENAEGGAVRIRHKQRDRERDRAKPSVNPPPRTSRDKEKDNRVREKANAPSHSREARARPIAAPSAEMDREGARANARARSSRAVERR